MKALIPNIYCLFLLICLFAPATVQAKTHAVGRRNHRRAVNDDPVAPANDTDTSPSITLVPPVSKTVEPPKETPDETPPEETPPKETPPKETPPKETPTDDTTTSTTSKTSSSSSTSDSETSKSSSSTESSTTSESSSTSASESSSEPSITPPPPTSASASASTSTSESEKPGDPPPSSTPSSTPESDSVSSTDSAGQSGPTSDPVTSSAPPSSSASDTSDPPSSSTSDPPSSSTTDPPSSSDTGITLIPSSIVITLPSSTIDITIIPSSSEEPPPSSSEPPPPSSSEPPPPSSSDPPPPSSSDPPPPSSSEPPPPSSSEPPPPSSSDPPPPSSSEPPTPSSSSSDPISFPEGPSSSVDGSSINSVSITTVISVPSDLSFILTESSLAQASLPTNTITPSLSDPDQPTTTIEISSVVSPTAPPQADLPEGMPSRIYPSDGDTQKNADGSKVLISILFDLQLNWPFVVNSNVSASQIFGLTPLLILAATGSKPENWALQVNVPADYIGPADQDRLGTVYLAFLDPAAVDTLAAAIKVTSSPFYTGVNNDVAKDLAHHVVAGFSVKSVNPVDAPGGGGGAQGSNAGAVNNDGKQRQDAIIGVVSALGAVAVLVLVFLVFRSLKRRRELNHRRLSDPPDDYIVGARPAGRDFDQDSIGGQRRRSYYFAEDSLRDTPQHFNAYDYAQVDRNGSPSPASGTSGMRERRVAPNAISAPVLQASSMNW